MIRVGIDTGGTFTDLVAVDEETGAIAIAKVPSTPESPVDAVTAALDAAGVDAASRLARRGRHDDRHQRRADPHAAPASLYLTTKGFEDIPFIQRISRKYHYDYRWRKPTPLVLAPRLHRRRRAAGRGGPGARPARRARAAGGARAQSV